MEGRRLPAPRATKATVTITYALRSDGLQPVHVHISDGSDITPRAPRVFRSHKKAAAPLLRMEGGHLVWQQ